MSEQKPTMKEIHSVLCEAWAYFDTYADEIECYHGRPEPNAEKVLADLLDDMITRMEQMEEVNV